MPFRGSHTTTVDEKGRLKVPAEYKATAEEECGPDFYVTSFDDGQSAMIYPSKVWAEIEKKLAALPSMNEDKRTFLEHTNRWGGMAKIDGQGRILIPAQLREPALMKGEVRVMGFLDYLQAWNRERHDQQLGQNPLTREILARLGV